jgi:hypothetical protein
VLFGWVGGVVVWAGLGHDDGTTKYLPIPLRTQDSGLQRIDYIKYTIDHRVLICSTTYQRHSFVSSLYGNY